MMGTIFSFFANYLIEFMGVLFFLASVFRWMSYRQSKRDNSYYSAFSRELELNVEKDKDAGIDVEKIDVYLSEIMGKVGKKLPQRTNRFGHKKKTDEDDTKKVLSLREYSDGKNGLLTNIQSESSVFHCKTPPNFNEVTTRIMSQDTNWMKIGKIFPIDGVTRMIDVLPGIFVVLGVFGTFIGIAMALPEIAKLDFNDLEKAGETLTSFVTSVTFSMETSISGIFFSLLLTIWNTLSPIKEDRRRIFKKVESSLQLLWYHIHKDAEEEEQQSVMSKLLMVLERMEQRMDKEENEEEKQVS